MSRTPRPALTALALSGALFLGAALAGCSGEPGPETPTGTPAPTSSAPASTADPGAPRTGASATEPTIVEPTTTNTLPPPPPPTAPAPSTAGELTAASLPRPAGWRTVAREGGAEEGFQGNGTWVHAKDPRYAASDLISIGCAPVTRDDYPDPRAALEGSYARDGAPGVGLVLQFADATDAGRYLDRYVDQVRACTDPDVVAASIVPSDLGLIDRRTYPDGEWTEVGRQVGDRLVFVILAERLSVPAAEAVLRQIR